VKGPGGKEFSRLIGIGISPGSRLKISRRLPNGGVIVEIEGGKAAVAEEIARSIFVRKGPLDEDGYPRRSTELG
jgi:Fe2+ transport system protein FeoA